MDISEFYGTVTPFPHQDDELILDVRVFGDRQGEAIECFLQERRKIAESMRLGNTKRLVVLLCDETVEIIESTMRQMEDLALSGQWVEIRHSRAERAMVVSA